MWYRNVVVVAMSSLLLAGCSSSPDLEDVEPVGEAPAPTSNPPEADSDAPRADYVADAYDDAAQWLPADSLMVGVQADEILWDLLGDLALPMADPDAEPGEVGTLEGLQRDAAELSRQHFGFDIWQVDATVVSIHDQGGLAVMLGDVGQPADVPTVEVAGNTVYVVDLSGYLEDDLMSPGVDDLEDLGVDFDEASEVYLLPIDEPRSGLVATLDVDEMESIIEAGDEDTLAGADIGTTFEERFEQTAGAEFAGVVAIEEAAHRLEEAEEIEEIEEIEEEFGLPEWLTFSFGDALNLSATGQREVLAKIEDATTDIVDEVDEWADDLESEVDESPAGEMALAYVRHVVESISAQSEPNWRADNRLEYEVKLSGGLFSRAFGAGIVSAYFTVPLFLLAMPDTDAKFTDAEDEIEDISVEQGSQPHEEEPSEKEAPTVDDEK